MANPRLACWACSIAWPPSSTCSAGRTRRLGRGDDAVDRRLRELGRPAGRRSTVAKAIVPSFDTAWVPCAYGLTTAVTCGSLSIRARSGVTTRRTSGAVTVPARARKTIWSASPACAAKRLCSRSTARCEEVPGSEKSLLVREPIACEPASRATAAATHATTTVRRCAIVHRVSLSIGIPFRASKSAERAVVACVHLVSQH